MPDFNEAILFLTKKLYPSGRAFKMAQGSNLERLHLGLGISEDKAYNDALSVLHSILPDNIYFTADDATDWERRLGMISNPLVDLEDRKLAIARKLSYPGSQPAHGHYLFLQDQLQKAGFNVYVYENRFPNYPDDGTYYTRTPFEVAADISPIDALTLITEVQHGDFQHGDSQHGIRYNNIIANYIDQAKDMAFDIGGSFRSTFFIGGDPIGSFASVPAAREAEFRELILKMKQVQDIGFLFINYI